MVKKGMEKRMSKTEEAGLGWGREKRIAKDRSAQGEGEKRRCFGCDEKAKSRWSGGGCVYRTCLTLWMKLWVSFTITCLGIKRNVCTFISCDSQKTDTHTHTQWHAQKNCTIIITPRNTQTLTWQYKHLQTQYTHVKTHVHTNLFPNVAIGLAA